MNSLITPTLEEFKVAFAVNGYPIPVDVRVIYESFVASGNVVSDKFVNFFISTKREMAMFIAQCFHESQGFQIREEEGKPDIYVTGDEPPGRSFYGRGWLQLTWIYNYERCSEELYKDNRLVANPELLVANEGAWTSAFWFWCTFVHKQPGVTAGRFNQTTFAISPLEDCDEFRNRRENRFDIYIRVLQAFNVNVVPLE